VRHGWEEKVRKGSTTILWGYFEKTKWSNQKTKRMKVHLIGHEGNRIHSLSRRQFWDKSLDIFAFSLDIAFEIEHPNKWSSFLTMKSRVTFLTVCLQEIIVTLVRRAARNKNWKESTKITKATTTVLEDDGHCSWKRLLQNLEKNEERMWLHAHL
jgi:hypothetical protein